MQNYYVFYHSHDHFVISVDSWVNHLLAGTTGGPGVMSGSAQGWSKFDYIKFIKVVYQYKEGKNLSNFHNRTLPLKCTCHEIWDFECSKWQLFTFYCPYHSPPTTHTTHINWVNTEKEYICGWTEDS